MPQHRAVLLQLFATLAHLHPNERHNERHRSEKENHGFHGVKNFRNGTTGTVEDTSFALLFGLSSALSLRLFRIRVFDCFNDKILKRAAISCSHFARELNLEQSNLQRIRDCDFHYPTSG
jgi:hypothetical protein